MQTIILYRFTRKDGGVTVSTVRPESEHTTLHRLVADEGMTLADGTTTRSCVDTEDPSAWAETVDSDNTEISSETLGKAAAYDILMGVAE